jgi:hypothetical protein
MSENANGYADTVCSMATVLDMAMVKSDVLSDRKITAPCRPPLIHLTRLNDKSQSSSPLLDDGWWMDDKNMVRARQSKS